MRLLIPALIVLSALCIPFAFTGCDNASADTLMLPDAPEVIGDVVLMSDGTTMPAELYAAMIPDYPPPREQYIPDNDYTQDPPTMTISGGGSGGRADPPWSVSGPTLGSDFLGSYEEYTWQLGSDQISIGNCGPEIRSIPPFDETLGKLVGIRAGMDLESIIWAGGECDIDDRYPTAGVPMRVALSWIPSQHPTQWPTAADLGQPGDAYWRVAMQYGSTTLHNTGDVVPISWALADDGRKPRTTFDGALDWAGTSGGTTTWHEPPQPFTWGPFTWAPPSDTITFHIDAAWWTTCNPVGMTQFGVDGHGILRGAIRRYYR